MSEAKRIKLRAYPRDTELVCIGKERSLINLSAELERNFGAEFSKGSRLIYAGGLCLEIKLRTKSLKKALAHICEHSDAVCIGSDYPGIFSEHGVVLIDSDALKKLSAKACDRRGHVL